MLIAGELSTLPLTLLRSFRVALPARAVVAAKGLGVALVRGREPSPGARFKPENVLRVVGQLIGQPPCNLLLVSLLCDPRHQGTCQATINMKTSAAGR